MKKRVLLKHLQRYNCVPTGQQTGSHARYRNLDNGLCSIVPIHDNISEPTAYAICKQLGIPRVGNN